MRAIILCAGQGSRCQPVTIFAPKPLIPAKGVPLLERQVRYLREKGIEEITLVLGHLAEMFEPLAQKYNLATRVSPSYATTNNNTSLALVADLLEDSLLIDGDLFFTRDWLGDIVPGFSQFLTQPICGAPEWAVHGKKRPDGREVLQGVIKWTMQGYGMSGVSYWQGEGARALARELENCRPDEYWEDAAIRAARNTDILCVRANPFVREMDSLGEARGHGLIEDDGIAALCDFAGKPERIESLTNSVYLVRPRDGGPAQVLRVPGKNTEKFINRGMEPKVIALIEDEGITPKTVFYPDGFKLCAYLDGHRTSRQSDMGEKYFRQLADLLARMHAYRLEDHPDFEPMSILGELLAYEGRLEAGQAVFFELEDVALLRQWAGQFDKGPQVLCHRDLVLENILIRPDGGDMQLIDFEYAGFGHPLWDSASFILEAGLEGELRRRFFTISAPDWSEEDLIKMEILVDYIWGIWGYVKNYGEYARKRLKRAKKAFDLFMCGKS